MLRNALVLVGVFALGCLLTGLAMIAAGGGRRAARSPALPAGATRPVEAAGLLPALAIDATLAYDIYCSIGPERKMVYLGARVVGFVGDGLRTDAEVDSSSSGPSFVSYSSDRDRSFFRGWLVLRLPDGRKVYLPADAVQYFEEARVEKP